MDADFKRFVKMSLSASAYLPDKALIKPLARMGGGCGFGSCGFMLNGSGSVPHISLLRPGIRGQAARP